MRKKKEVTRWTPQADKKLEEAYRTHSTSGRTGLPNWGAIAKDIGGVTNDQCWQRWKRHVNPQLRQNMKTTPWTKNEDAELLELVGKYRTLGQREQTNWGEIEKKLSRSYLSCRNRYLCITKGPQRRGLYTSIEDDMISEMVASGEKFDAIGRRLGRSARSVQSRELRMRLKIQKGADLLESLASGKSVSDAAVKVSKTEPKKAGRKRKRVTCSVGVMDIINIRASDVS